MSISMAIFHSYITLPEGRSGVCGNSIPISSIGRIPSFTLQVKSPRMGRYGMDRHGGRARSCRLVWKPQNPDMMGYVGATLFKRTYGQQIPL